MPLSERVVRPVARAMVVLFWWQTLAGSAGANPVADPAAPAGRKPIVDAAPNGVKLVHIAPANGARVSHNLFSAFNVPAAGVILNNKPGSGATQLGGTVGGNPQLGSNPASLIINEVTAPNVSSLLGRTEVAGAPADVVIANPWGITCDGCGFINASRGMLTTGRPAFAGDGGLAALNVEGGSINIGLRGIDAAGLRELDLLARTVTWGDGAVVTADNVYAIGGRALVAYDTLATQPLPDAGNKPSHAVRLPPGAVINANQIYLVSTEQGVGVRNAGSLNARTGGLQIDTGGQLLLDGGRLRAEGGAITLGGASISQVGGSTESSTGLMLMQAAQGVVLSGVSLKGSDLLVSAGTDAALTKVQLQATGDLRIMAGGQLTIDAGALQAGADLLLSAGRDLQLGPTVSTGSAAVSGGSTARTIYVVPELRAGRDIVMQAPSGIVNLDGAGFEAGGQIAVVGQSIGLIGPKDYEQTSTVVSGVTTITERETLTPGSLHAGQDISLLATGTADPAADPDGERGHILLTGARVDSDAGQVSLLAQRDVDIANDVVSSSYFQEYWQKRRRLFYTKTTHVINSTVDQEVKPSIVGGKAVSVAAGQDLNVVASSVLADGAVGLHADNDLSLLSTGEVHQAYNLRMVKKSGLFGSGTFGITIGSNRRTEVSDMLATQQIGATIGSQFGDISATAGNQFLQLSSEIVAALGDVSIAAREVAIQTNNNTRSLLNSVRQTQSGITLSAGHPIITAAQTTVDMAKAVERTENPRLKALGIATAGLSIWQAYKELNKTKSTNAEDHKGKSPWTFNVTLGSSSYAYDSVYNESLPQESQVLAGRNLTVMATGSASTQQGDISVIGSGLSAGGDVTLSAGNDIHLVAATAKTTEQTRTRSSSGSIGMQLDPSLNVIGITLAASKTRGFTNGWGTTYFPVEVAAGGTLSFDSWRDTNASGAALDGTRVIGRVGSGGAGNLMLASPQDQSHFIAKESSLGLSATIGSTPSLGLSLSHLQLLADWQSVREQTAIRAGSGGFDLNVNGTTYLRGAAITSNAPAASNRLVTQTLLHETATNRDNASGVASSASLNLDYTKQNGQGALAGTAFGYAQINRSNLGHTVAAVAPATVSVTRGDLQANIANVWRTRERTPVAEELALQQTKLTDLLEMEPPKYPGMGIHGGGDAPSSTPEPADGTGVDSLQTPTPEWTAWNYQVTLARNTITQLTATLTTIDTKVYGQPESLSRSPNGSHQPLPPALDGKRATEELRAGVAITAAFGKAAFKEAGDYADKKRDEELKRCNGNPQGCVGYEAWKEGGKARTALHTVIGALGYGTAGAVGAAANQLATPVIESVLIAAGLATRDPVTGLVKYTALGDVVRVGAGSAIGYAVGAAPALAAAATADANNRQLHPEEKARLRELAAGDAESEQRLAAAACYMIHCAAEFPQGSEAHDALLRLERVGETMTAEIALLRQQRSADNRQMFTYSFWNYAVDGIVRLNSQYGVLQKLGGSAQLFGGTAAVLGGATIITGGTAACPITFGGSCFGAVAGGLIALWGMDQVAAGTRSLVSDQPQYTLGAHLISEVTGISKDAAELWYAIPGVTVGGTAALNASRSAQGYALEWRVAHATYEKFVAQGVQVTPEVLGHPTAQRLIAELQAGGRTAPEASMYAEQIIESGASMLVQGQAVAGQQLFKAVPRGSSVSPMTAFWMNADQAHAAANMSTGQMANFLGLPAEVTAAALANGGFDFYAISLRSGHTATVFNSTTARTAQRQFTQTGGVSQTIVPNRTIWTDAVKIDPSMPGVFAPRRCC